MKPTKLFFTALTIAALTAGGWAQSASSTTPTAKKKHKPAAAASEARGDCR